MPETYRRTADHIRILEFVTPEGARQTFQTTDDHPFWVESAGRFVNSCDLRLGDAVTGPQGERQRLNSSIYEPHPEGVPVFNFQVENFHTYFVQAASPANPEDPRLAAEPVWVHNAEYGQLPDGVRVEPNDFPTADGRLRITARNGDDILFEVRKG